MSQQARGKGPLRWTDGMLFLVFIYKASLLDLECVLGWPEGPESVVPVEEIGQGASGGPLD